MPVLPFPSTRSVKAVVDLCNPLRYPDRFQPFAAPFHKKSEIPALPPLFLLTWDSHRIHNNITEGIPTDGGGRRPFAERPESGPRMGGGCDAIERPAISSLGSPLGKTWDEWGVCCGKSSTAETCTEQQMMLMTLLGFLWAVLLLAAIVRCADPSCCEKMFRLARRPILVPVQRPARRFLSSVLPWRFYPIMAPPGAPEPTHCRRSCPFRRF